MSFYTIAETRLTTADDRKRHPRIDKGQVARLLVMCAVLFVAVLIRTHHG